MKCRYKQQLAKQQAMKFVKEIEKSRREERETEHKGYKMVEYKDTMMGETFFNAELYNPEGKMMYHATTRRFMDKESIEEIIDDYIEKGKAI